MYKKQASEKEIINFMKNISLRFIVQINGLALIEQILNKETFYLLKNDE